MIETAGGEQLARFGDIELCYQSFGEATDPCLLLISGLGMQMIAWDYRLCALLVAEGFRVVRFDNRDSGRSTHLDHLLAPSPRQLACRRVTPGAYTLADMAADTVGLLDHLGVGAAHVVGASMGAMIAQTVAARWPTRVRSLVSLMGSTGSLQDGQPAARLWPYLLRRAPSVREEFVERLVRLFRAIGSPAHPTDEAWLRTMLADSFDRGATADGLARQLGAIFASGSRRNELEKITAPTLVLHGAADRLIPPSGGRATHRAIPASRLVLVPGMGHDLPEQLWPLLISEITDNAHRHARSR